jgi:HSP20 family protein
VRYNPFQLEDVPATLRAFQDSVARLLSEPSARPWTPPVDIYETENDLVLKADVPELNLKDVDIRVENGTLTIKGERKFEQKPNQAYHRIERSYGSFARSFVLPDSSDPERIRAEYKAGVLTVTIPKKDTAKPRTVKIDVVES